MTVHKRQTVLTLRFNKIESNAVHFGGQVTPESGRHGGHRRMAERVCHHTFTISKSIIRDSCLRIYQQVRRVLLRPNEK